MHIDWVTGDYRHWLDSMTDNAAAADVTDDVSTMTSPSRRTVDFSISSLLSSQHAGSVSEGNDSRSLMADKQTNRQLQHSSCSTVDDLDVLVRHRLAAAALWYPWLHSVASLHQSVANEHHLNHGKLSILTPSTPDAPDCCCQSV